MTLLEVTTTEHEDGVVLTLHGELDMSSAPIVERELNQAEARRPASLVLDFSRLTFMDSSGLRLVLAADQRGRRERRRVAFVPGPDTVHRVFRMAGLEDRLEFLPGPREGTAGTGPLG